MIRIIESSNRRAVRRLIECRPARRAAVERQVARIVARVRRQGDRALVSLARRHDALNGDLEVTREEMVEGARQTPADVREAIRTAARHLRTVARRQVPRDAIIRVAAGIEVTQRVRPLRRVGCYVPGGRFPLPSSLLMTAVPARTAGVAEIVAVCPRPEPAVLCAALEAGVSRLFRVGGAHAIAALAYGTPMVPRVDKIVGPGNAYVTAAKARVAADCAIDFLAGPSEIVVISENGEPGWVAADLLAQAEHDPDARALLLTSSRRMARRVARELATRLPARGAARGALARNGGIILTRSADESIRLAAAIAPEHLVCPDDDPTLQGRVAEGVAAGAVFLGRWTAQAAGDYATGSNHVLPTGGGARSRGGLSAADFVRVTSIQRLTREGLARIAPGIRALAGAEGLAAHAASIALRLKDRPRHA